MPTLAALTNATSPPTDGLSFLPTLLDKPQQQTHAHLYWEYGNQTAVRMNQWKALNRKAGDWELYDLSRDVEEKSDIAADHPEILDQLTTYALEAHEPVKGGEVYDRKLIEKDRRQAPHKRVSSKSSN